jgi:type IV secretory pathway TrbD component
MKREAISVTQAAHEAEVSLRRSRERRQRESDRLLPRGDRVAAFVIGGLLAVLFVLGTWCSYLLFDAFVV